MSNIEKRPLLKMVNESYEKSKSKSNNQILYDSGYNAGYKEGYKDGNKKTLLDFISLWVMIGWSMAVITIIIFNVL